MSTTYAAVGSDGTRLVVWGLGATHEEALAEAQRWVAEAHPSDVVLECHEVTPEQVARILAGDVAWR